MKIAIASMWYPISISRYFLKALENMPEVEAIVTVGPTSGASIPWGRDFRFPRAAFYPDFETSWNPQEAGGEVSQWLAEGQFGEVDLWIDVDAGFFIDADLPMPHVVIGTDSHCLNYDRQREVADFFFNMHRPYMKEGDIWLPYCYSEFDHYPEDVPRKYDVTVLGLQYTDRVLVAETLSQRGYTVYRKLGDIWGDYRRSLCSAPICFTWSSRQDLIARVFEGLACKRLVVCNRVPDLKSFFEEGEDLAAFSTHQEAISVVEYYANNPMEASNIADRGYEKVQGHTYTNRLRRVFETVGIA